MAHDAGTDNRYTRGIAQFVSGLRYEAIPEEVRSRAKLLMLDSLGCAIYGADLQWSRILQDKLGAIDATRTCAVWGTNQKLSAPHAALVNGKSFARGRSSAERGPSICPQPRRAISSSASKPCDGTSRARRPNGAPPPTVGSVRRPAWRVLSSN